MDTFPIALPVIFGAFVVLMIVVAIASSQNEKKRQAALASFAASMGLQIIDADMFRAAPSGGFLGGMFTPSGSQTFVNRFQGFSPFGVGSSIRVKNLLVGNRDGIDWYFFDYYYTTSDGKNTTTHHYAVLAARMPLMFPKLNLRPENVFTQIGQHVGFHELKFELDAFNQRYFITCDNDKLAYDILCPQAIEYLMRQPIRSWQFAGYNAVVAEMGALTPELCYQVMQEITGFVATIPNYVKQDIGFQPRWTSAYD